LTAVALRNARPDESVSISTGLGVAVAQFVVVFGCGIAIGAAWACLAAFLNMYSRSHAAVLAPLVWLPRPALRRPASQ
jgi:hypothetical protein